LVAGIIPDAYEVISRTADEIISFLQSQAPNAQLGTKAKTLIRDVLRPALMSEEASASTALFVCFTQVEAFLRRVQGRFAVGLQLQPKDVYSEAGVKNPAEKMTLGDLLQVYSAALKLAQSGDAELIGNWESVVELRNAISHGRYRLEEWREALTVILAHHHRIENLLALVLTTTGEKAQFTYFGS